MNIYVEFHTNVDPKYTTWYFPEHVCCRPMVGDLVKPINDDQTLKISSITHCVRNADIGFKSPYLRIELIKTVPYHD